MTTEKEMKHICFVATQHLTCFYFIWSKLLFSLDKSSIVWGILLSSLRVLTILLSYWF